MQSEHVEQRHSEQGDGAVALVVERRGRGVGRDEAACTTPSSSHDMSADTMLRWVDTTPFGRPVEPDV